MRISDWSSDVCSSDLRGTVEQRREGIRHAFLASPWHRFSSCDGSLQYGLIICLAGRAARPFVCGGYIEQAHRSLEVARNLTDDTVVRLAPTGYCDHIIIARQRRHNPFLRQRGFPFVHACAHSERLAETKEKRRLG